MFWRRAVVDVNSFIIEVYRQLDAAIAKYDLPITRHMVRVVCNIRGGVAGYAERITPTQYRLRFNHEAILKYPDQMVNDTIPHEIAHIVCYVNPQLGKDHDDGWKRVCRELGGDDSRCHDMVLTKAKEVPRYKYTMPDGREYNLAGKQHNAIQNGTRQYTCRHSGAPLKAHYWEGYNKALVHRQLAQPQPLRFKMNANGGLNRVPDPETAGKSKMDIAKEVFAAHPDISRREFVEIMIAKAHMTEAGAGTYYYNLKKKK
jgi:SprT protein